MTIKELVENELMESMDRQNLLISVMSKFNGFRMTKEILSEITKGTQSEIKFQLGRERTILTLGWGAGEKIFLFSNLILTGIEFNDRIDTQFIIKHNSDHFSEIEERNQKRKELIEDGSCDKLDLKINAFKEARKEVKKIIKFFGDDAKAISVLKNIDKVLWEEIFWNDKE